MEGLSDYLLLEAYEKAQQLNLDQDFIQLLDQELERRESVKTHKGG